jgi:hypothetical protein
MDDRTADLRAGAAAACGSPDAHAAREASWDSAGRDHAPEAWDEPTRLALAGIVVRHAELRVPIPEEWRQRAIDWLEHEEIEWDEATARRLRRQKEIDLLQREPG